jgi:hypothetical protein
VYPHHSEQRDVAGPLSNQPGSLSDFHEPDC